MGVIGIFVFMGIGLILGLIIGNLIWHKDRVRIKLQEQLIDHYKGLSEYFESKLNEVWKEYHNLQMDQLDDTFKELEKVANEWGAEKDKNGEPKTLRESVDTLEDVSKKYHELLLSVESKCPGETRHETALRYISEAGHKGTSEAKQEKVQNTQSEGDKNV